jgi:hypothetical protein
VRKSATPHYARPQDPYPAGNCHPPDQVPVNAAGLRTDARNTSVIFRVLGISAAKLILHGACKRRSRAAGLVTQRPDLTT